MEDDWTNYALLAGLGAAALWVSRSRRGALPRSASGRWAGAKEREHARRTARRQQEQRAKNKVALQINPGRRGERVIPVPHAERGVLVMGQPGSGKTYSAIDPLIRSALRQGFPLVLYDFKYPTQTRRLFAYARHLGYTVQVFAPGFAESAVFNPLELLVSAEDSETARQLAEVLNRNFKLAQQKGGEDAFFGPAGDQLAEAVLLTAKASPYPDLLMVQSLLSLDLLPQRLQKAEHLSSWVKASYGQFLSAASSEKTAASIVATASALFTRFLKPQVARSFAGPSAIDFDLSGKKLLVLGVDRTRRDVVLPLVATLLHMLIQFNTHERRTDPLVLALDELPTLFLPALVNWLNENREDGLVSVLGLQNLAQLERTYGKETAQAIFGACATKFLFNPGEKDSAQYISDMLGQESILQRSISRNTGKGGPSRTHSQSEKTRPLLEASGLLKLGQGHCILLNPEYSSGKEAGVPMRLAVRLEPGEIAIAELAEKLWPAQQPELLTNMPPVSAQALAERQAAAERFLPLDTGDTSAVRSVPLF
ncbi:MAG: type IV secretion system DNA-binding domain-containing protein [Aphanocapsa lilacina HA4352-LM1]|jgi:type IV secretory pathway TraG/TraD family ATPase VirD4|nr:type IV secretion system DNA-binding domain-containing protein [Aphanocapsa lilacina HA4352-LM1]